ncbi:negative regulator of sigma E activity [Rheinheimera sp. A13L]|uniref:sigma-E factor negative regulatory protein n=1 Tax=Rheinheimera sp. A13L TaxID=506534 RepID=UPI00021253C1|nr:RseA family anti-sigma factor [Rheinheimera sp. A13L]EGM78794.1 negative regulator of sigma E activity [Rheinheimera sp. A13L]
MSSEKSDWISAASDNQAISPEQLDRLLQDAEVQQSFARYHLIGAAIRNELPAKLDMQFADNFASLLDQEPAYQLESSPVVHHQKAPVSFWTKLGEAANTGWFKTGFQGTVAASVALVAVLGVQQFQGAGQDADLNSPLPVLQTQPVAGFATPVSLSQTSVNSRFEQEQRQAMLEQQQRLQQLLQAHRQQIRVMDTAQQKAPETPAEKPRQEQ